MFSTHIGDTKITAIPEQMFTGFAPDDMFRDRDPAAFDQDRAARVVATGLRPALAHRVAGDLQGLAA